MVAKLTFEFIFEQDGALMQGDGLERAFLCFDFCFPPFLFTINPASIGYSSFSPTELEVPELKVHSSPFSSCQLSSSTVINCFSLSRYTGYSSTSLWPAPSTHKGSTALGHFSKIVSPCEKSITSS